MKVLADLHHFDLYYSFQLLFEKRLGWEIHRPIGLEWATEGFWRLSDRDIVARGYLSTKDGECAESLLPYWGARDASWARFAIEMLRVGPVQRQQEGFYLVNDQSKNVSQKAITLQYFKENKFDILISSVPQHFEATERLRQLYQPQAKHIFHMGPGNVEWEVPSGAQNIMVHTMPSYVPRDVHYIKYCQEFDLDVFRYQDPVQSKEIFSYVHFPESEQLWQSLGLDWKFRFIGKTLGPLDGVIINTSTLADTLRISDFTWHVKPGGESYGHIIHNTYAVGRPAIINMEDFQYKRAGVLLEDMVTCIDVTGCSPQELKDKLLWASQPETHLAMCKAAHKRFTEVVNFNEEEKKLRRFMENLR